MTMTVGMLLFILMIGLVSFVVGWLMSATATSADIAQAIATGKLSLDQPLHDLCEQIESGHFKSLKRRATFERKEKP